MADERIGVIFTEQGLSELLSKSKELKSTLDSLRSSRIGKLGELESLLDQLARATQEANRLKTEIQTAVRAGMQKSDPSEFSRLISSYREERANVRALTNDRKVLNLELAANSKAMEAARLETQQAAEDTKNYAAGLNSQAEAAREAARAEDERRAATHAALEEQYRLQELERQQYEFDQSQKREEEIEQLNRQAEAAENLRNALQGVASVLNTAGSVSNLIGDFASGIGNSFSGMASLFGNASITDTLLRYATVAATNAFAGDMSSIISRYDIMSTFIPYMGVAGVDETMAQASLDRINQSILGLPIGLDEAAQRLRRYQMFLGDIDAATNLTIGAQHAILAGGASDQMKTQAYYQIDRLLSAGRLSTSRQWLSLIQGMGVSMRFISEQMGVAGMDVRDLAAGLASGAIEAQAFLQALMDLGEGTSDAAQGLEATLEIYKGTVEAWINSINFAVARGGERVMKALNQTLVDTTGQGITGFMKDYRDFLDTSYKGVAGWIEGNPQMLLDTMGHAEVLIESISRFSASNAGALVLDNLGRLFDSVATALNSIPDGKLEEFAAFATTLAGPLGAGFSASSGLGVMLGVFERFKGFKFNTLVEDIADATGTMSKLVNGALNLGPLGNDEFMSNLLAYGLVFGKPVGTALQGLGGAISSVASLALFNRLFRATKGATSARTIGGGMDFLFSAFEGASAGTAGAAGFGLVNPTWSMVLAEALPALLGQGALTGGLFSLLSAASNRRASDMQNALGYMQLGAGAADVQSVLSGVLANTPAYTAFTKQLAEEQKAQRQSNIDILTESYNEQVSLLAAYSKQREEIQKEIDRIEAGMNGEGTVTSEDINNLGAYKDNVKVLDQEIGKTKDNMSQLNDAIVSQGTEMGKLTLRFGDYEIVLQDTSNAVKAQEEVLTEYQLKLQDLAATYKSIREAAQESILGQLSGFGALEEAEVPEGGWLQTDTEGMESQIQLSKDFIEYLTLIDDYLQGLEADSEEGINLAGFVHEILSAGDLEEVVPKLREVADQLGEEGGLATALETFASRQDLIEQVKTTIEGFGTTVDTFITKASDVAGAVDNIKTAGQGVNLPWEESFNSLSSDMDTWVGDIPAKAEELSQGVSAPLAEMSQAAEENSEKTTGAIEKIAPSIGGQVQPATTNATNLSSGIASGLASSLSDIEATSQAIVNAISALSGLSATITINTVLNDGAGVVNGSAGNSLAGMNVALPSATGGSVFRAFGSDIVPYMLTPGEFVIRKGAVDFFGKGLMDRINALDIGGAFDRLMLSPPMMSRFGGNVYNRDSHNNVTQNVYTNNPNFANKRAWRFAL